MDNSQDNLSSKIERAITDLRFRRASMFEVGPVVMRSDTEFARSNPEHPLAYTNRFKRQKASSFFLHLAEEHPSLITGKVLDELHISLFDCDPAVRYDIARALGILSKEVSSRYLLELLEKETVSKSVKRVAETAYAGLSRTVVGKREVDVSGPTSSIILTEEERHKVNLEAHRLSTSVIKVAGEYVYYIILSALSLEKRFGLLTEIGQKNLALLRSPDFEYSIDGIQKHHLLSSIKRMFILDLRERVSKYEMANVTAQTLIERMLNIGFKFRAFGYSPNYAGHESSIRERILMSVGKTDRSDMRDTDLQSPEIRKLVSYYMAFTDYEAIGVPFNLDQISANDSKIFISHSSLDKNFANQLATDLFDEGLNVWLDEWELKYGDSLWDKIDQGITRARFMLLILSPESVRSNWVKKEYNAGLSIEMERQSRFVIPILYKDCAIPTFIKEKFHCDLSRDYDANFERLIHSII